MEWRTGKDPNAQSVIVPDELVVALLDLLQGAGVPLDPYSDITLSSESTQKIEEALRKSWDHHKGQVEDVVKQELGVWTLPAWAEKMVAVRMEQDHLMTICAALIALCESALVQNVEIEVLGQ